MRGPVRSSDEDGDGPPASTEATLEQLATLECSRGLAASIKHAKTYPSRPTPPGLKLPPFMPVDLTEGFKDTLSDDENRRVARCKACIDSVR